MATSVVLWGGPEDGREVKVKPGDIVHVLDSPFDRAVGISNTVPNLPVRKACYRYNGTTLRFEWEEYL